jgi:calcineurin-like phosphoesterase family protein
MSILFTSDNHFFHRNILNYCSQSRPFENVEDMNEKMVKNWNLRVNHQDDIFCLGDFSFGDADQTRSILRRLKGRKHLIFGNHDQIIRENPDILQMFETTQEYKEFYYHKKLFCLFHYPITEWNKAHHGSFQLHGHQHNTWETAVKDRRQMDIGVDSRPDRDVAPWTIDEVIEVLKDKPNSKHHSD